MIRGLMAVPEAPRWEIPFAVPSALAEVMGQDVIYMDVDLSFLEQIMPFVRLLILLGFVLGLVKLTPMIIKW
jgi:hypothetical protein